MQNFTVIFTIANFFEKFCPFFGEKFCTVQKKSRFFTQNIAEKYSMQKLPQKICEKIYEKINGKYFNLLIRQQSSVNFRYYTPHIHIM